MIEVCRQVRGHHLHLVFWATGEVYLDVYRIPEGFTGGLNRKYLYGNPPLPVLGIIEITASGFRVGEVDFTELNGALDLILVQESFQNLLQKTRI